MNLLRGSEFRQRRTGARVRDPQRARTVSARCGSQTRAPVGWMRLASLWAVLIALAGNAAEHWAYQLPKKSPPPEVHGAGTELDQFIFAKLAEKSIKPAAQADKVTLARRLYFDLIGLPPTPKQIDEFLAMAVEHSVDRLLQSPHFGERWARHWLDVVRFGESVTL